MHRHKYTHKFAHIHTHTLMACTQRGPVTVEFDTPMKPLCLAPRFIDNKDIPFVLKDLMEGRRGGAYFDLAPGGHEYLSRSRVHTVGSGK